MKLRSLVLIATGVGIGLAISRKLRDDDPDVVIGPAEHRNSSNPALRLVTQQSGRLVDRATVVSLEAIRRARGAIRARIAETSDDALWN